MRWFLLCLITAALWFVGCGADSQLGALPPGLAPPPGPSGDFGKDYPENALRAHLRGGDPLENRGITKAAAGIKLSCFEPGKNVARIWDSRMAPLQTVHYNVMPRWLGRNQNCGRPASLCAFLKVADIFQRICRGPGCRVQFGDFYSPLQHGIHSTHWNGECVDVMPFRKNDDNLIGFKINTADGKARYSPQRTQDFIALARAMGAEMIIFADVAMAPDIKDPKNHADHIHLCFPENSRLVQAACQGDLNTLIRNLSDKMARTRARSR